ncbi:MAG: helix-turn-helix transcriptional regulator [Oscillospiraceae bacterium]
MPKSQNQKFKLLYIMEFMLKNTDEEHPVTTPQLIEYLDSRGVSAERKSIYGDIETLRLFGLDIMQTRAVSAGYYIASRNFELPELKLLVDSVQSSKFITEKKTLALIKKIEGLASSYDAKKLHRQVFVKNRIKNMNESIYYNVDDIHAGISGDRKISFKYFEYSVGKDRVYKHGGKRYLISPFALTWDDENYYLIGYDEQAEAIKHFRVDKMAEISVTDEERGGKDRFEKLDVAAYTGHVFGMFTGEERAVRMVFDNRLAGAVIDRFGKGVILSPSDGEHFTFTAGVAVSPQFFGWICGFGEMAAIVAPAEVRQQMGEHVRKIANIY